MCRLFLKLMFPWQQVWHWMLVVYLEVWKWVISVTLTTAIGSSRVTTTPNDNLNVNNVLLLLSISLRSAICVFSNKMVRSRYLDFKLNVICFWGTFLLHRLFQIVFMFASFYIRLLDLSIDTTKRSASSVERIQFNKLFLFIESKIAVCPKVIETVERALPPVICDLNFCNNQDNGMYSVTGDATQFYHCSNKMTYCKQCQSGLTFDQSCGQCVDPNHTTPTPATTPTL